MQMREKVSNAHSHHGKRTPDVAATQHADTPAHPAPVVRNLEHASQVNGSTFAEKFQGGMSGVPLMAN